MAKNTASSSEKRVFVDWARVNEIPITEVCKHFGLAITLRNREPWCKLRDNETIPSTVLHTEARGRFKENTYHDFGTNESGDNVSLACRLLGLNREDKEDRYQAAKYLSEAFYIPFKDMDFRSAGELSNLEYHRIGLYGDLASKNLSFDPAHMTNKEMQENSEKYNMPMNQLKKAFPRTYEGLLKTVSIPHLQNARNNYYMNLWTARLVLREICGEDAKIPVSKEIEAEADELRAIEKSLNRAIHGTHMDPMPLHDYDPESVLARMDNGELQPNFGAKTKKQMERLAKANHTEIKYRMLDLESILYDGKDIFGDIPYSAFFVDGKAMVGYLSSHYSLIRSILEEYAVKKQPSKQQAFQDKLKDAGERVTGHTESSGRRGSAVYQR